MAAPPEPAEPSADDEPSFIAHYLVPGAVGTALIALSSIALGWLPLSSDLVSLAVVDVLRTNAISVTIARIMLIAGGALLLQTWLVLGADMLSGLRLPLQRLWWLLAAWCAPLMLAAPLFSRDVYSYFAQGRVVASGLDPYSTGVAVVDGWFEDGVDPMWAETPTPYGPFWLLFARGVANFAPEQPALAALVFRLSALAGLALLVIYLPRLATAHGINAAPALWLGVLNPLVVMHVVSGAHNDALMIGLIVMGFALASERHPAIGVIAIAVAAAVKPIALLALPFIGLVWAGRPDRGGLAGLPGLYSGWGARIRAWVLALLITIAVFAIASVLAGVGPGWIAALGTPGEVRTWLSPATAIGMLLGMATTAAGLTIDDALVVTITRTLGTLAALAIVAWLILRPEGRSPAARCRPGVRGRRGPRPGDPAVVPAVVPAALRRRRAEPDRAPRCRPAHRGIHRARHGGEQHDLGQLPGHHRRDHLRDRRCHRGPGALRLPA